jgi:hypothetical protein
MAAPEEEGRLDWIHTIAERKIQEAMDEGLFDNLPGKGKPLVLDDDPLTPAHLRLTHHVLKNANVVPEWIAMEKEIEAAKNAALGFLERWESAGPRRMEAGDARAKYLRLMKEANDLILKYNLINPFVHRAPVPFRIKKRLEEWDTLYGEASQDQATSAR